ncbi:MAG TPA: hypothetical protein DCS30_09130 [Rhizobiales bacterium]|nr:hypothetical protein [Hyphomicrobiales bacterium]
MVANAVAGRGPMEVAIKDLLYVVTLAIGVAGSHFMLRARVMVLEEKVKGYSRAIERIFDSLQRIEEKLDGKEDRRG